MFREPFDVLDAGRVAAIRDPTGAIVALWQPASRIGAALVNDVGAPCWNELVTPDVERAKSFFGELLGWRYETAASGYTIIENAGRLRVFGDPRKACRVLRWAPSCQATTAAPIEFGWSGGLSSRLTETVEKGSMDHIRSTDGTTIAFDRLGSGPAVILAGGAFSYRAFPKLVELAELLAKQFTVINYDRRGRGDSGDTPPYAVEREIEDLQALIDAAGGSASFWGWSSGAVLGLPAAARGVNIERLALFEPPFIVDDSHRLPPADFATTLSEMTASDRRGDATRYYMTKGMGVPRPIVTLMRFSPFWSKLKATAHTLPYDWAILGDTMAGKPLAVDPWASATVQTLVIAGEKSPEQLRQAAVAIADVLPNAEHRELKGQSHNPSMKVLAPVLEDFFSGENVTRLHPAA